MKYFVFFAALSCSFSYGMDCQHSEDEKKCQQYLYYEWPGSSSKVEIVVVDQKSKQIQSKQSSKQLTSSQVAGCLKMLGNYPPQR